MDFKSKIRSAVTSSNLNPLLVLIVMGKKNMENAGIDPAASRMLSERAAICANSPR